MRRRVAAAALLLGLGAGCPDEPPGGPPDAGPDAGGGTVELGTGSAAFEPLAAEQPLDIVAGPQGGYHFIVHARMREMAPGDPTMPGQPTNPSTTFSAFDESGVQIDVMNPPYRLGYEPAPGVAGAYDLPGGRILQLENAEVPRVAGGRVRITVRVRDAEGRVAEDERWVQAIGPDGGP